MKKRSSAKVIIFLTIIITIFFFYNRVGEKEANTLETEGNAYIESITIYGRFFNIEGYLNKVDNIDEMNFILYNSDSLYKYNADYIIKEDKVLFQTNEKINEGVLLDDIPLGSYNCYIEVISEEDTTYYSFTNNSDYKDEIEYWTMTKDNKNNLIKINSNNNLTMSVRQRSLPNDVYDIVIDPGHGGIDPGAVSNKDYEKNYNLSLSIDLKKALEQLGYKVKLTRTGDYFLHEYDEGGRINISHGANPKLLFSVHLNSVSGSFREGNGGVEIYAPYKADLTFARSLAKSIVTNTGSQYSKNPKYKVDDGVYVRAFLKDEIEKYKNETEDPYPYTTDTTYYYMLRETGGIITGAYVDGRNASDGENFYYNSNVGIESYILELGYIISEIDLSNIKENSDKYIDAIKEVTDEYLR